YFWFPIVGIFLIYRFFFFVVGSFSNKTTAWAMAALSVPMPSGVLALIPMQSGAIPISFATFERIALACGPIFGAFMIRVESTLEIVYPAALTPFWASRRKTAESAPFHFGSDGENKEPISGAATAPSRASVMA